MRRFLSSQGFNAREIMWMMHSVGAFLWDDLDHGQWYEITQIKVHRMNWWILSKGGFIKFLWRAMIRVIMDYWSWCGAFQWNSPCESYSSVCEICLETGIREYTVHRTSYFPQTESDYSKAWCKSSIIFYTQHLQNHSFSLFQEKLNKFPN